jgi:glycosyltransferase involved in cell wall biosynthesis
MMLTDITVIIPNFKTLDITRRCVESLRAHYSDVKLIVVDDCSLDDSAEYIMSLGKGDSNCVAIVNERNLGEGGAFDVGIHRADTRYVFTMHSDCVVLRGGFIEKMLERFRAEPNLFALGWLRPNYPGGEYVYVAPHAMMMDREKYLKLPPLKAHGAPAFRTMAGAHARGYVVEDFPIQDYVKHTPSHGSTGEVLKQKIQEGEVSIEEIDEYWRPRLRRWRPIRAEIEKLRRRT